MKTTTLTKTILPFAAVALLAATNVSFAATTIISNTFSLGYGYASAAGWDDSETSGSNTGVTGDFTLSALPTVVSAFSDTGVLFSNRLLANGGGGTWNAQANTFTVDLVGSYTGVQPAGTTTLVIDSISMWVDNHTLFTGAADEIRWSETTVGNTGTSPFINLGTASAGNVASTYQQLSWNPGETAVTGTSSTRIFEFDLSGNDFTNAMIDGFEVTGHLEFTPVPEPSTTALLGLGGLALILRRRR
jgi:hypothetical protein